MKVTFSIPNYPAFWNREFADTFTQDEIAAALQKHEAQLNRFGFQPAGPMQREIKLISEGEPSFSYDQEVIAAFESSGDYALAEERTSYAERKSLHTYLQNVRNILEANRGNFDPPRRM